MSILLLVCLKRSRDFWMKCFWVGLYMIFAPVINQRLVVGDVCFFKWAKMGSYIKFFAYFKQIILLTCDWYNFWVIQCNEWVSDVVCCFTEKRRLSLCVGCGSQIHDQYILRVAPDLEWHAACLKCAECHQFLDENCTCFVRDGKTYCKRDYVR